jgi:hypothetical protein
MGEELVSQRFCPQAARIGEKFSDANSPRLAVLLCELPEEIISPSTCSISTSDSDQSL